MCAADRSVVLAGRDLPAGVVPDPPDVDVSAIRRKWLDVPYADRSPVQKLDLYLPGEGDGPFPLIVYIHGGAFMHGDKRQIVVAPFLLGLERGYAVASLNYRLSGEATFPAGIQDVKAAIRWLRRSAGDHLLDGERFAVCGDSSGANFAAMVGLTAGRPEFDDPDLGDLDCSCAVQAVVDWFGPTDFLRMDTQLAESGLEPRDHGQPGSPESLFLGARIADVPEKVRQADPITYAHAAAPPFLIQHGRQDNVVPWQQSAELAEALKASGAATVDLGILEQAGHGDPLFRSEENMQRVFAFLDRHVR